MNTMARQSALRSRTTWAFLLATVVVVAGCSSGGSSSSTTSHGAQASGPTGAKIGVEGPMTGIYAEVGAGFWQGAQAAAREINAEGGLLGGKLSLDQADDVSDPSDAIPAIRKLVNLDHIDALDGPNSTVLPAIESILTSNKIPTMFEGGSTAFDTNTNPWIWRPSPSDAQLGVAMAAYALSKHYATAAMMFSSAASAQTLSGIVEDTYTKNGGKIVSTETLQPGATSYRSEVAKVVASKPDVIFTQVDPTSGAPLFTDFAQTNSLAIPFIGSDLTAGSDFIKAITASVANRALVSIQGSTNAGPGTAPFLKYYGELYKGEPISGANYSYDAIMELALAMQAAGTTDTTKVNAQIPNVSNVGGTDVSDWATALADLKAGKKVHFVGAGGPAGYDSHHNALGAFSAFQSTSAGVEQSIADLSIATIQSAESGTLNP
jgi:branched-chain amino acid transport system substrate-binding protein